MCQGLVLECVRVPRESDWHAADGADPLSISDFVRLPQVLEEVRLAEAEKASATANTKIETRVVNKTQYIKTRGADIVKYVDREVVKYDDVCKIPQPFIKAHNDAAEAPKK
jgi:hypothetical protein